MSKTRLILLMSLCAASGAFAQGAGNGITMSTDPAKAAAVERHAQEIKARPAQETQAKPAAKSSSSQKAKPKTSTKHKATAAKPAAKK
jgi:hypothetical protein